MFRWAIIFAVIALIASLLGFGGVAGLSKDFAIILLVIALILAIFGFLSRGKVSRPPTWKRETEEVNIVNKAYLRLFFHR